MTIKMSILQNTALKMDEE